MDRLEGQIAAAIDLFCLSWTVSFKTKMSEWHRWRIYGTNAAMMDRSISGSSRLYIKYPGHISGGSWVKIGGMVALSGSKTCRQNGAGAQKSGEAQILLIIDRKREEEEHRGVSNRGIGGRSSVKLSSFAPENNKLPMPRWLYDVRTLHVRT